MALGSGGRSFSILVLVSSSPFPPCLQRYGSTPTLALFGGSHGLLFLVLLITSVYSFFFDKQVTEKPDAYGLVSCAAFAIMSLGLSRLSHFGFEVDLG